MSKEKMVDDIRTCAKIIKNPNLRNKHTRDDTQKYIPYLCDDRPWFMAMPILMLSEIRTNLQNYSLYLIKGQFE